MASIHIRFGGAMGSGAPVISALPRRSETVTSSTSSAATTIEAVSGDFARISAIDGGVYFTVGASPVALSTGAGMDIALSGTYVDIGPLKDGEKIAVIDV